MFIAQAEEKNYINYSQTSFSSYLLENEVWLNIKNIYQARLSQKLDAKNIRLFKIQCVLSIKVFELELLLTI